MALNIKIILLVLVGVGIALFLIQNVAETEIQFLVWAVKMSRSTLVLLVLGIGVIIGWILSGIHGRSQRRKESNRFVEETPAAPEHQLQKRDSTNQDE